MHFLLDCHAIQGLMLRCNQGEESMRRKFKRAALAIVLATFANTGIASADVDTAQITVAYADGYTGTDGQFHAWEHRSDAESFRATHGDRYRPWRHDNSRHKGDH